MIKIKLVFLVLMTMGLTAWLIGYDEGGFGSKAFADVYEWYSNPTHPLSPYNPLNPGSPLYDDKHNRDSYGRNPIFAMGLEIHKGKSGMVYNHNEFSVKIELCRPLLWNHLISTKILASKSSEQYGKILRTDKIYVYKKDANGEFKKWSEIKLR